MAGWPHAPASIDVPQSDSIVTNWLRKIRDRSIIRRSGQFDPDFYSVTYPDLAQNRKWGRRPLGHFVRFGASERRAPRPGFDTEFYLLANPEVEKAGVNPFRHYLRFGYREGRTPSAAPDFFSEWRHFNPQVSRWNLLGQLRNWRDAWEIKKSHRFSPEWYWGRNPDVLEAAQNSFWWPFRKSRIKALVAVSKAMTHPIRHFVWCGVYEGRHPGTEFDPQFYVRANADMRSSGVNPFVHYLRQGIHEDRPARDIREVDSHETGLEIHGDEASQLENGGDFFPKVSVIVPNYNHAEYLSQRLDSIYGQTYENIEVILLDDRSEDNSQAILREYAETYPSMTRLLCNETNSGNVFRQWAKGIEFAEGELVWIAESDDFCDPDFLEKLVSFFRDEAVTLAYSNVSFVDERGKALNEFAYEHYLAPVGPARWKQSHTAAGFREVERAFGVLNLVPNTSGCVFRKPAGLPLLRDPRWLELKICGDWVFYLHLIQVGKVSFCSDTRNYYRFHNENASVKTYGDAVYYQEHEIVAQTVARLYGVKDATLELHAERVRIFWQQQASPELKARALEDFYDLERIRAARRAGAPSIMIGLYSFTSGGGEVLPIRLANALDKKGFGVTMLEFFRGDRNSGVRQLLNSGIPVVSCNDIDTLRRYVRDFGIDVFNSHHLSLQNLFRDAFPEGPRPRHVAVTHGLLDTLTEAELSSCLSKIDAGTDHWIYGADKNLVPFESLDLYAADRFSKLPNGMERSAILPVSRQGLGISDDAFVLCLVSRAMVEKGWSEAIEVVSMARERSGRDIHLLLVGDGEECERLGKTDLPDHVHLLGFRANPLDYYAASDMGFLPSRYRAETFPLTIVEALFASRPVIASDVGDVRNMLDAGNGQVAGAVFSLDDWKIPVEEVAGLVSDFAVNASAVSWASRLAWKKSVEFEIDGIADRYAALFAGDSGSREEASAEPFPEAAREPTLQGAGFCPVCIRPTIYRSFDTEDDWFNSYRCQDCESLPRDRAVQHLLDNLYPDWRTRSLHESSPCNELLERESSDYSASQYYTDRTLGDRVGKFRNENLESMTFEDERFDFVIALEVMEHVFHPDRVVREMFRCVRPGGAVIFTTCLGGWETSRPRASQDPKTGEISHLLEPVYHGNPIAEGALLTWDFGDDFPHLLQRWSGVEPILWHEVNDRMGVPVGGAPWVWILPKKG
jgi:glycosyltransferase involved in cell wall biosynthesis